MRRNRIYEYTQGDNSMLFLLYGVATIFITIGFFIIWRTNVKSAYTQQKKTEEGKKVLSLKEDLRSLLDKRLNSTLLFFPTLCVIMFNDPAAGVHDLYGVYKLRQESPASGPSFLTG